MGNSEERGHGACEGEISYMHVKSPPFVEEGGISMKGISEEVGWGARDADDSNAKEVAVA